MDIGMSVIPITVFTGFLGSGKTTLILNLLPQLPKGYKIALLKNEFGDLAVDSKLASAQAISGVQELLNGCICCNLVGQLGDALETLRQDVKPDRIIIETSGSAFPATLALEVNRLARETGAYVLDGVVSVIDVENWKGYEDTSYTAKMQAKYTDMIVLNKWELVNERRLEECEDRILDLEVDIARIRSNKGRVPYDVLIGLDSALAKSGADELSSSTAKQESNHHDHQGEVEVLSVCLVRQDETEPAKCLDVTSLESFLRMAPKEEIYRIKGFFRALEDPILSQGDEKFATRSEPQMYILNWSFGRWTFTKVMDDVSRPELEMTIVTARGEADKWRKRIENIKPFKLTDTAENNLIVKRST